MWRVLEDNRFWYSVPDPITAEIINVSPSLYKMYVAASLKFLLKVFFLY